MAIDEIDWLKLKPYKSDKHKSFEQLSYQVAKTFFSDRGKLTPIDDSGGGSGVEFYLDLPDGTIWGWQAKFYPGANQRLNGSRRRHIIESLRASRTKYGKRLERWYLCTTIDFEPTGNLSELEWFEKVVQTEAGGTELIHWGESELLNYLGQPRASGILGFFFGQFQPTPDWFKRQVQQQLANLGDKYVAELHTRTSTEFELNALAGDDKFRAGAHHKISELRKAVSDLKSATSAIRRKRATEFADDLTKSAEALEGFSPLLDRILRDADLFVRHPHAEASGVLATLEAALKKTDECSGVLHDCATRVRLKIQGKVSGLQDRAKEEEFRQLDHTLNKPGTILFPAVRDNLMWLRRYASIRQLGVLHLLGGAGSGKTYTLAQICSESKASAILLRGASFSRTGTIQVQILGQLKVAASWNEFASALETYGGVYGVRVLIAIDALNESQDVNLWEQELRGFEKDLDAYPHIALVTSCRGSYFGAIWKGVDPNDLPFWFVSGFSESELKEAIPRYFNYYRIVAATTLGALKEFEHPLYLRMFCEAENPNRQTPKQVFLGEQRLFAVFEKYLEAANSSFSKKVNRPPEAGLLQSLLHRLARTLWDRQTRQLPYSEATELFDGKPLAALDWDRSFTKALCDEELVLRRSYFPDGEGVEFTYDLLGGYLIADEMLAMLPDNLGSLGRAQAVGAVATLVTPLIEDDWAHRHPLHEDILRAFSVLFPARTGIHLLYIADHPRLFNASVNALFEIDSKHLSAGEREAVRRLFQYAENRPALLTHLRDTAFSPGHPLNARFLGGLLFEMSMAERDLYWSEYLREHKRVVRDTLREFREALLARVRAPEGVRQLRLGALFSLWVLTSNDRGLRDTATEVLMMFGRRFPGLLFRLTEESLTCNDPYIPERMLAASYGAAMALHRRPGRDRFRDEVLPTFARRIFEYMFRENAPLATTHALRRDYAQKIIDLAIHWHRDVLTPLEQNRVNPPFDGGIRNWRRRPDYDEDRYREGNAPLEMDWENYTMGSLVPGRSTYDYKHPGFVEVKENILWRIHDLGYSLDRFGEIDKSIARMRFYRQNDPTFADGYGQKYAWIGYYELYGLREDLGMFKDDRWRGLREGPHPSDADIDPSFPVFPHRRRVLVDDILGRSVDDSKLWVRMGPTPSFKHYLARENHDNEPGPWLLVHAVFSGFRACRRSGFAFVRAFFVREDEFEKARRLLRRDTVRGSWLPDVPTVRGVFAGEFPWRPDIPLHYPEPFNVPVGKKRVRNDDVPRILIRMGGRTFGPPSQKTKWRYEPINETFELEPLVESCEFGGRAAQGRPTGTVPSKQLCDRLGLWLRLPTWDMYDPSGRQVSITTGSGGIGNGETTVYMRQELLDRYLHQHSLRLIWIVWGERQQLARDATNGGYKYYKQLYGWDKGVVKNL